jgi:hypothetical protein
MPTILYWLLVSALVLIAGLVLGYLYLAHVVGVW